MLDLLKRYKQENVDSVLLTIEKKDFFYYVIVRMEDIDKFIKSFRNLNIVDITEYVK